MASIEFIEKRLAGKEREVEKLLKKLERIKKAEASNYKDNNPYYYSEWDMRSCLRDLERAQKAIDEYKEELKVEKNKQQSRNIPVILEFLEQWKERVFTFYEKGLKEVFNLIEELRKLPADSEERKATYQEYVEATRGIYEEVPWKYGLTKKKKVEDGRLEYVMPYYRDDYKSSIDYLKKDLEQEANRKYDFIIERTIKIVETITDASDLKIGAKGDLNGIIYGTKGAANVKTIGAGGYNIQCYHFRTLIKPVRG